MLILVVEDEAIIALVLELALRSDGHQVLGPAVSVEGALQLVDDDVPPGLALVDINLRDRGDGLALARILRNRHDIPSLFLSAQTALARANRDAAIGLIGKPYDPETVLTAIKAVEELKMGRCPVSLPAELELF